MPTKKTTDPDKIIVAAFPGQTDSDRGPRISNREKLRLLKKEIEELRSALGLNFNSEDEWGQYAPQELRDQKAAAALMSAELHPTRALLRLGFKIPEGEGHKWRQVAARIFGSPGVQSILAEDAKKMSPNREIVIDHLMQGVKYGDDRTKTSAAGILAKMIPGWLGGQKDANSALPANYNLLLAIGGGGRAAVNGDRVEAHDPDNIIDAEEFLVHTPGEAVLVDVDEQAKLTE